LTSYHPLPPPTTSQNLVGGTYQNLVVGGGGIMPENIDENVSAKTSLKTIIQLMMKKPPHFLPLLKNLMW
jgi:hypothetical protein